MLPPGAALPTGDMAQLVIKLVSSSFALVFQLAAPFLVFGFAIYAALGVLAKAFWESSSPAAAESLPAAIKARAKPARGRGVVVVVIAVQMSL